ncbi:branched-chain amino acid ABC transporter permease [Salarchaeum sp. JOR-1]|uniref:branched-chain amino acid ABC transporter permease n=1 Tax=Salarchaeum sp. JOR-1 TaxID=2599399 RepID=UPI0011989B3E|nr:branched-chain amino acid ABC transporter permease [Salarchaeum sp. JOR-1]QDX40966.1 branched-chain amino acid ABC transporter permease [Salarchaeum sp. JOR-1]
MSDTLTSKLNPLSLPLRQQLGLLALALLGLTPFWMELLYAGDQGLLHIRTITIAMFIGMFAMSWDSVSGYTGQISFGHALFFAIGGYGSALLNLGWGVPPVAAVALGTVLAAVAGLLIGVPALRLEGPYLSLVTLVAPLILLQVFIWRSDVFGGELGVSNPDPLVATSGFAQETYVYFYVGFALFVLILAVLLAVTRSDAGSILTAIREDEDAVAASGLNPAKFKTFAFVLSASVGGLAGAVFVHTPMASPTPSQLLAQTVSIEVIIASVLGGMGTIVGAALGGMFLSVFRSQLSNVNATVPGLGVSVGDLDLVIFAVVTLFILFALPGGVLRWGIVTGRSLIGADGAAADGGRTPVEQTLERFREFFRGGRDD